MTISSKFRTGLNNGAPGGIAIGGDSGLFFDGENDRVTFGQLTDAAGFSGGKEYVMSLWFYVGKEFTETTLGSFIMGSTNGQNNTKRGARGGIFVGYTGSPVSSSRLRLFLYNVNGSVIVEKQSSESNFKGKHGIPAYTWNHIFIAFKLNSSTSISTRIVINGREVSMTGNALGTEPFHVPFGSQFPSSVGKDHTTFPFTLGHPVNRGSSENSSNANISSFETDNMVHKMRMAHFYVASKRSSATGSQSTEYTSYRTSDGFPTELDLEAQIGGLDVHSEVRAYLPMNDPTNPGKNLSEGNSNIGDFTLAAGVITSADVTPENSCSMAKFTRNMSDVGSSSRLLYEPVSASSSSGSQGLTFSVTFRYVKDSSSDIHTLVSFGNGGSGGIGHGDITVGGGNVNGDDAGNITISFRYTNGSGNDTAQWSAPSDIIRARKTYTLTVTYNANDISKSVIYLNGVKQTGTGGLTGGWALFTGNDAGVGSLRIGAPRQTSGTKYYGGGIGELYFNTSTVVDLDTENPFWDSENNRAIPVATAHANIGGSPLLVLPMRGGEVHTNLGTYSSTPGGSADTTFAGLRSASEYWARTAAFDGAINTSVLRTSALTGSSNGKEMTIVCAVKPTTTTANGEIFGIWGDSNNDGSPYVTLKRNGTAFELDCDSKQLSGMETLNSNFGNGYASKNNWQLIMISVDMTNTSKRHAFVNGQENGSWGTYNNNDLEIGQHNVRIGDTQYGAAFAGDIGFFYFVDSYIDFSQEANRDLFIDPFGYPKNLTQVIGDGDLPNPLIYMKFEDTDALGINSGTGGDFTVNGTVINGSDALAT
jgi:hypothetical protein